MGAAAGPDIVEDNLIFAFDPADIKSFGRTTSSPIVDVIGRRSFTNYNSAAFSTRKRAFSASTNEFFSNQTAPFVMPDEYTFSMWLQPFFINTFKVLFTIGGWSSTAPLMIYFSSSVMRAYYKRLSYSGSGPLLTLNNWQNIVLSCQRLTSSTVNLKWYKDAEQTHSTNLSNSNTSYSATGIYINNLGQNYSFQANANFGPIRIYDKVLTLDEIKQNYQSLKNRFSY